MSRVRYAATVVLCRPDPNGAFDVLLTRRPEHMRFLGGFYVFPGGSVHKEDSNPRVLQRCRGLMPDDAQKILGGIYDAELSLGHWIAAIRELFEEVGILLCVTESGAEVDSRDNATRRRLEQKRRQLVEGNLDFATVLESEGLFCDLSRPVYFYHRVTPEIYPIRFDTRFYLASLPAHQNPLTRSEEVTDATWIKPEQALARAHRRDFPLLPPTTTVLEDLAQFASWGKLRERFSLR